MSSHNVSIACDQGSELEHPAVVASTPEKTYTIHRYMQATPLVLRSGASLNPPLIVRFLDDGNAIVGMGPKGNLRIWDARSGDLLDTLSTGIGPRVRLETIIVRHHVLAPRSRV